LPIRCCSNSMSFSVPVSSKRTYSRAAIRLTCHGCTGAIEPLKETRGKPAQRFLT
jgi:hypothetical protein